MGNLSSKAPKHSGLPVHGVSSTIMGIHLPYPSSEADTLSGQWETQSILLGREDEDIVCASWRHDEGVVAHLLYLAHRVDIQKLVVANQLKGTISEVMDYTMTTESGEEIDIGFGYRSVGARIVASTDLIGTTTTLLKVIGKKAVEIYNK